LAEVALSIEDRPLSVHGINTRWFLVPAIALLIAMDILLLTPRLFPNLAEINWDESFYISNGRALAELEWVAPAENPLTGFLYVAPYAGLKQDVFWLLKAATVGRFVMLFLLWGGCLLFAAHYRKTISPLVFPVLFVALAPSAVLLNNSSDGLFAAFAALALVFVLDAARTGRWKAVAAASVLVSLAALSRNDGLVLFVLFFAMSLWIGFRRKKLLGFVVASLVPFLLIVGQYLACYGVVTGDFHWHLKERAYLAFTQGEGFVFADEVGADFVPVAGMRASESLYGSPAANDHSIMKAISHNPRAFLRRLGRTIATLPAKISDAYGSEKAPLLILLALIGAWSLVQGGRRTELYLLALWPAYLLAYFITFFRAEYLAFSFSSLLALAAVGLQTCLSGKASRRMLQGFLVIVLAICLGALIAGSMALLLLTSGFFASVLAAGLLVTRGYARAAALVFLPLFVAAVLIPGIHVKCRALGGSPDEASMAFLRAHFGANQAIAAFSPTVVVGALQSYRDMSSLQTDEGWNAESLRNWLAKYGVDAVYVDGELMKFKPRLWRSIEKGEGAFLTKAFVADGGIHRVFVVDLDE